MVNFNRFVKVALAFAAGWLILKMELVGFVLLGAAILWPSCEPAEEKEDD